MQWVAIFQAIAKAVTNAFATWNYMKETKRQQQELTMQTQEKVNERAKMAKHQMQEQKNSFLKSGVYFNSGSPLSVINETYTTAQEDMQALNRDNAIQQSRLRRAGKTAFFTFLIDPVGNDGGNYANNIYQGFQNSSSSNKVNVSSKSNRALWSGSPATSSNTGTIA